MQYQKDLTKKYEDPSFPPGARSLLGKQVPDQYNGEWSGITWKRASEIFTGKSPLFGFMDPSNIVNGYLPNYYFTSAVAAIL